MSRINNLTEGSIFKKLLFIAVPILLTSISQMAYNIIDMIWIGRVDNIGLDESNAISAIGSAGMLVWFAMGIILIPKIGTSVKVSHAAGEHNDKEINDFASNGMILQFVLGIIVSLSLFFFRRPIIDIFNISSAEAYQYAVTYLAIVGGGIILQFLASGFASINEGLGLTKTNLYILVIGLVLNVILDPIFILVLRAGVAGAAIATVISQAVTLIVFFIYYFKKNQALHQLSFKAFHLDSMKQIVKIGLPTGVQSVLFTMISIVIARIVFSFGEDAVSAQRIGVQIEQFTWMIGGGFQSALTVFVGQNYSANQPNRIRGGIKTISLLLLPYSFVISLVLILFPEEIIRIFVDKPIIIAYGAAYLRIISLSQMFMMMEAIGTAFFNGLGKTTFPSTNGIIFNSLRIPLALYLIQFLGQDGIWWTFNVSSILKGLMIVGGSIYLLRHLDQITLRNFTKKQKLERSEV